MTIEELKDLEAHLEEGVSNGVEGVAWTGTKSLLSIVAELLVRREAERRLLKEIEGFLEMQLEQEDDQDPEALVYVRCKGTVTWWEKVHAEDAPTFIAMVRATLSPIDGGTPQ